MARDPVRREQKQIDVNQVVDYLNRAFDKASELFGPRSKAVRKGNPKLPGPPKGSMLYEYQVDFCYLIDDIQRGPQYLRPKVIQAANDLINEMTANEPTTTS